MNYFNQELEGRSLRTVAFEIIRANENLLHYMSDETLENALKDDKLMSNFFKRNINYDAEAFRIWCTSPMQNESISSGIFLYDMNEMEMGSFSVGLEKQYSVFSYFDSVNTGEPNIKELNDSTTTQALTTIGILPVTQRDIVAGYVSTTTEFNINNIGAKNIPDFLKSNTALIGAVIDESLLKIFEFTNSRITQVYGDIYPSREQMAPIVNAELSELNDAWVKFSIYGEDYIAYVVKTLTNGSERLITVAAKEKEITWNLFNFFKIFLIHTIFILLLFVALKITNLLKIQRSFRTKLLYAILFVSIVPLALLAVYNRQVVSERSEEAIFNELSKRSDYLENHVRSQLTKHKDRELSTAFSNAGKELKISFSVYKNTDLIYSSRNEYYRIGLFHYKLNPAAHYNLNYLSYREYSTIENIDKYNYDAYYRKININGEMYIVGVNDAFNRIRPAFSTADIDVILFGIYSFAVIIIIIVSTVLANQISAPIRRLTKATEAVAQGDLSVELENNEKGEMKDLYDVFNLMTHELQKNQIEIAELERESAWKEMAKQVAHEIKNPLTPVKLAIQQLVASYKEKSKDFDKTFDTVTKTTLSQIDNLSQIASEFSSFAKMPSIKLEEVNFVNVINDVVSLFKDNVEIKFNSDVHEAIVESDASQMRRMLINIIRNSIQADATEIILNLSVDGNNYFLLVEDNGNGIDEKYKNEIFKMNFTTKEKGMGLGLKLAKRFIESIGGKIHLVESQPSKTVFGVIIPKHKSHNDLS
jgi:signal transduction histidine kinase